MLSSRPKVSSAKFSISRWRTHTALRRYAQVAVDEAADRVDEFADVAKLPRRMAWRVMIPKKISTRFNQDPEVGGEVQGDPWVAGQPGLDGGVFVGGVVVADDVQLRAAGRPWRPA